MIQAPSGSSTERPPTHPRCPLCSGSQSIRFLFERNGNSICSCAACNLEFQFPQPADHELAAIYSSSYFLGSKDPRSLENQRTLKRATANLYLDTLRPLLPAAHPRLLEIGCGHGEFLLEAQARGFQVEGLEYSEHAANEANTQLGGTAVRVGSPEADCLPPAAYDVIAAFDVIEHLRHPQRALDFMYAAILPEGLIAIVTPSLDSWSRRLLGRYWMEYKTEHLTYFSRKSLRKLLENAGFSDIQFAPNYKSLNLDYVAAHFDRFPVPIATPLVRLLNRILPRVLALRPLNVVASGIVALARKRV